MTPNLTLQALLRLLVLSRGVVCPLPIGRCGLTWLCPCGLCLRAQIEHLIQTNTWSKFKCTVTYRLCCFAVHLARSLRGDAADSAMDAAAAAELEVQLCVELCSLLHRTGPMICP